ARGYAAAALNGDIVQAQRERTVNRLKSGQLDIVVATDVAARGLDVERISHVVNFDVPTDTESYVHRIGRTGRAGRAGDAILFLAPRERHLLKSIERATRQAITPMELPSVAMVNDQRIARFKQKITETLSAGDLAPLRTLIEQYEHEQNVPLIDIATALARMAQGDAPLTSTAPSERRVEMARGPAAHAPRSSHERARDERPREDRPRPEHRSETRPESHTESRSVPRPEFMEERPRPKKKPSAPAEPMETYRIEVGNVHGVKPANIVGAIANEAGLDAQYIGRIDIKEDHSFIDLPEGMPKDIYKDLQKVWVSGQRLRISRVKTPDAGDATPPVRPRKRPQS
ncbi:MAG: DbpA RNA binding domain-containing protein, partial [Stenotrophobium sp.]